LQIQASNPKNDQTSEQAARDNNYESNSGPWMMADVVETKTKLGNVPPR
jgi:hypothetical protein